MRLGKFRKAIPTGECCVDAMFQNVQSPRAVEKHCDVIERHLEEKLQTPPHDQWRKMSTIEKTRRLLEEVDALEQLKDIVAARRKRRRERTSNCDDEAVTTPSVSLWTRRKRMKKSRSCLNGTNSNSNQRGFGPDRMNARKEQSDAEERGEEVLRIRPPNVNVLMIAQESLVNRCNKLHLRRRRGSFSLISGEEFVSTKWKERIRKQQAGRSEAAAAAAAAAAETALDQWVRKTAASRIVAWLRHRRTVRVM